MKKLLLLMTGLLLSGFMSAQEVTKDTSKEAIGETNKDQPLSLEDQYTLVSQMLDNKSFVIEANYLNDKWGNQNLVNTNLNFVMVDSTQSTIQIGSDTRVGPNGVGGITVKGSISGWKLVKDEKHKTFSLQMLVMTPGSIYNVFFDISALGNATATISGNSSNRLTFRGQIVPLEDSRVYVGSHIGN